MPCNWWKQVESEDHWMKNPKSMDNPWKHCEACHVLALPWGAQCNMEDKQTGQESRLVWTGRIGTPSAKPCIIATFWQFMWPRCWCHKWESCIYVRWCMWASGRIEKFDNDAVMQEEQMESIGEHCRAWVKRRPCRSCSGNVILVVPGPCKVNQQFWPSRLAKLE